MPAHSVGGSWIGRGVIALLAALTCAVLLQGPASAQSEGSIKSVSYWQQRFDGAEASLHRSNLPKSRSGDSWDYYNLAYAVDANIAMYEATGENRYVDRALEYVDNMIEDVRPSSSMSTSQYRDQYLGWVSQRSDVRGKEVPLFESYNWRYVTRLLRVMRQSPALYDDPGYRDRYEKLLAFTEIHMFEKWFNRGVETNLYRNRTHMASHWAYIAMNLSVLTADNARRDRYDTVFNAINTRLPNYDSSLRGQLREVGPAYFWSARWGLFDRPGQDVAHGNGVIAFVVDARDVGREWTEDDMTKFIATLTTVIWPRAGVCSDYVDGSGKGTCWFSDGFVKLGRYDPALQTRLETHRVQGSQFFATMANNARILAAQQS